MTEWIAPSSLNEALDARHRHPNYVVMAGGTDWMVVASSQPEPAGVIDLFGLKALVGISEMEGAVRIGAATTYSEILRSEVVHYRFPILRAACREVGALQIQERGTIGGNIATSSPVGDTLPVLLALDATIELGSVRAGTRLVPYSSFCTGYRKTAMAPDELITAVRLPANTDQLRQKWRKVGTRRAQAISKVMFAGALRLDGAGRVAHARLAFGAVSDRPIRVTAAEQLMLAEKPDAGLASRVAETVAQSLKPIDDVRSTADYRRAVASQLARAFIEDIDVI